jgi:hypothetical protein
MWPRFVSPCSACSASCFGRTRVIARDFAGAGGVVRLAGKRGVGDTFRWSVCNVYSTRRPNSPVAQHLMKPAYAHAASLAPTILKDRKIYHKPTKLGHSAPKVCPQGTPGNLFTLDRKVTQCMCAGFIVKAPSHKRWELRSPVLAISIICFAISPLERSSSSRRDVRVNSSAVSRTRLVSGSTVKVV